MIWWVSLSISVGVAIILGIILAFIIAGFLIKAKQKKIVKESSEKILKQDKKFIFEGKKYDLKAEIKKGMDGKEPEVEKGSREIEGVKKIKKTVSKVIKDKKGK
ncbi:hypothetical protein LCGC14_2614120 [marine sediment metagenome]|uniref:Uncharacterized protein n=1 Tax=marine sediment metagenome TaxID=412755 RepID=A0A0F9A4Z8_9ZZZZ